MSILQEYEEIRNEIGIEKYNAIEKYLSQGSHKNLLLSDILYKPKEWQKYDKWYNEIYKHRKIEILGIWKSDFGDVRCNAIIYQNNKAIGNIIVKNNIDVFNIYNKIFPHNWIEIFKNMIYENFDKYKKLPKLSKCSELLKEIYDEVCNSDSSMCYIDDDDWKDLYADRYNDKDVEKLKEEVKQYKLDDIITFNEGEYKILGFGNLEISFNDDRKINKQRNYER